MSDILVSIIVPIYNSERYLAECIESVLALKEKKWQLILVNDGSSDASYSICKNYLDQDSRIVYVEQKNSGVSVARNSGMQHAIGEWVMFLDSDDMLSPDACELIYFSNSQYDLILAGYTRNLNSFFISEECQHLSSVEIQKSILNFKKFKNERSDISVIDPYNRWSCWARFYRTKELKKHNIKFPKGIALGEDLFFNMMYFKEINRGRILINNSNIYYYRTNSESVSQKFNKNRIDNTIKLVNGIADLLIDESLKGDLNTFIIDRVTKCCMDYYTNTESNLSSNQAAIELQNLCKVNHINHAICHCEYKNIAEGKKNTIYNSITLFFIKKRMYRALILLLKFLKKIL